LNWAVNRLVGLLIAIPFLATLWTAHAQNATWDTNPGSSDWNTNTNWTPQIVPTGRASFGSSNTTSITFINAAVLVGTIQFNAGSPTYSFNINGTLALTGTGIINNSSNAPTFSAASGGLEFVNSTTAGNAALIATDAGFMDFFNTSTAGNAVITNSSNFASTGTVFSDTSTAGNATITNNPGGVTRFQGTSTAGHATITNNAGNISFLITSTAGNATITNTGLGNTIFQNSSTAGNAMIVNKLGFTRFQDTSTAGDAIITNNNGGFTRFLNSSTASNATITNNNGGETVFLNTSTAGNATITTNAGFTVFFDTSTAGNATITTNGGFIVFLDTSTASNATITTNGGAAQFGGTSTAGNATIMTNNGGITEFFQTSTGGNARFITNAGGIFDMSGLTTAGMTAGSIEGAGTYNLGSKSLSAGGNNLSTEVSGIIADGGNGGGTGGSLVKVGTGTLILSGANTYTGGTTIAAGTLQLGNGGASGSIVGNVIDNGVFAINRSDTFTFGGVISGTGSFEQRGASTTIFTGANTYTGGTTISAGMLQLGNGGASGSIVGNVIDNGVFAINRSDTFTFGGLISGTGSFEQRGASTTIFTGANTYTGGTTISAGMLQLGNGGASGSITGKVIDNSVFAINRSDAFTFGGVISGTGSFQQLGTGMTILSAVNSYGGGTTIAAGVLDVSADNNLGAASGGLSFNGGTLQFGSAFNLANTRTITLNGGGGTLDTNGFDTTISQGISGAGGLTKTGGGTLTLSGPNSYSGGTVLNAGILVVNNAQALGLGNVTVNGGVLEADPQPINVKGNYAQNAGGTLLLQVAGAGSGQYDFLNVSGNANLGGALQLTNVGYKPKAGDQLTLVTTGGSITSPFARWVDPFTTGPGINTIDLIYSKKAVTLAFLNLITPPVPPVRPTPPPVVITTINFASFAQTPNQRAAGNLLDDVQLDPRASNLMSFLYKEPFGNLPSDFDKISPESLTAFYEISFSGANIQRLNLENRLEDIRNSSSGASVTGATVYLEDKADGKYSKNPPVLPPVREKRWDFWSTSFGDFVHVDSDFNAHGYKFTTGGIDLGIDYRLTNHLAFGLMGNYAHTWTDLRPGSIDVDSARGGLYATYFDRCFYLNAGIYGGYNSYDSSRGGLQGHANGNSDGAEFSTFVSGGYDFHLGHLTVGPIASLQYTNVYVDSFREKGSLAPLSIHSDSEESLRSDVGFRASYQWQVGRVQVEPFLKATWQHEFKYSALPITASFANIPGPSATFVGPVEGHDSAVVDAGISAQWTPCISTYVSYNGLLGRDRYDSNGVSGGIRIRF
jgi:outer membrane autotransporter protein